MIDRYSVREIAKEVAPQLTGVWFYVEPGNDNDVCATLDGPDGAAIWLRPYARSTDVIEIRGEIPKGLGIDARYGHSIRVSSKRSPDDIAGEIRRRLLPRYLAELAAINSTIRAEKERDEKDSALAAEIALIVGGRHGRLRGIDPGAGVEWIGRTDGNASGEVAIYNGGTSVNIDIRGLTADQAIEILRIVKPSTPVVAR